MRLIGRNDLFLLLGLAVALFAIVSRPLGRVLAFVQEIDDSWGGSSFCPDSSSSQSSSCFTRCGSGRRSEWKRWLRRPRRVRPPGERPKWNGLSPSGRLSPARSTTNRFGRLCASTWLPLATIAAAG